MFVVQGEVVLVSDEGEEVLRAGDAAGFKAGEKNGHCLQNRWSSMAVVLEIGSRVAGDATVYPDIDMLSPADGKPARYTHRDGTPYFLMLDADRRGVAKAFRSASASCHAANEMLTPVDRMPRRKMSDAANGYFDKAHRAGCGGFMDSKRKLGEYSLTDREKADIEISAAA